jgi:hypothetical protein
MGENSVYSLDRIIEFLTILLIGSWFAEKR